MAATNTECAEVLEDDGGDERVVCPCENPHCTAEHRDVMRLWRIVRAQLEWYRAVKDADRGDLVLAEEAILFAARNSGARE